MTPFGRRLLGGLMFGSMIILGFFAWRLAPARTASPDVSVAGEAGDSNDVVVSTLDRPHTTTSGAGTDTLRPLPRAQGLPDPASVVVGPVGIRISDIRVDGDVVPVGVEADGSLEVPAARQVGWYRFGSNAGEPGSTVLAAHISYDGVDGVFRHLSSVGSGARVEIELTDGAAVEYRVVETVEYDKAELPVEDLFSESGADRLVLITCGGTFNPRLGSYDSNVVVHAVPVAG